MLIVFQDFRKHLEHPNDHGKSFKTGYERVSSFKQLEKYFKLNCNLSLFFQNFGVQIKF